MRVLVGMVVLVLMVVELVVLWDLTGAVVMVLPGVAGVEVVGAVV